MKQRKAPLVSKRPRRPKMPGSRGHHSTELEDYVSNLIKDC